MRSSATALFAVAVEASDEVPAVVVPERDCDISRGHLELDIIKKLVIGELVHAY